MAEMTGGELLLRCLKEEGVQVMFGVLDGSFNPFLAKLDEYGIRFVNARHEAAAAHMAEAWARVRGEPGVVVGGIGPGAANMVSGIVTACAEGSPVIALSGQRRRSIIYPDRGGAFQNVNLLGLYGAATKWSAGVRDWRRLPELLRRAFREALSGRPGPVYLELPEDLLRETGDPETVRVWPPARCRLDRAGPGDPICIRQAARMLAESERPFLYGGMGVSWSGAWEEFVALADYLAAPMTVTLGARGIVPEDHPRYLHILNREALELAQSEADVVLVVGSRLGELSGWGQPPYWAPPEAQKTIQVDVDPASLGLNRPVDLAILGDARAVLAALLEEVRSLTPPRREHAGFARYRELTRQWHEQLEVALAGETGGVNPGRAVQTVREFFPRDAITVMDGGNTSLWVAAFHPIFAPRSYLYTAKFGHLGTGLPYAIGAKLAAPDRSVVLISGDGAFGFNLQEMETASRHNLCITAVVLCDRGWGMERSSQMFAGIEDMVECDLYSGVRLDLVAQGFGWHGEVVERLEDLRPALERGAASGRPALVQVMVEPMANLMPPGILLFGEIRRGD